ncbi:HAMP domain-containing protein [Streptomyces sp. URMC 129]|uniref:HAMP domain-containing protein n=1 Tax=Streptomyces sp. URMC 129 TaxID=3423407 RepID=UPI003F1C09B9
MTPRWWRGRPLRARLVASSIAVLGAVLAIIAVVSTVTIRAFLMDQLDQRVYDAGQRAGASVFFVDLGEQPTGPTGLDFLRTPGLDPRVLGVRVQDDGTVAAGVLDGGIPATVEPLTEEQTAAVLGTPRDGAPHTRSVPGLGDYRLISVAGDMDHDGLSDTVVTGVPMSALQDAVGQVVVVEVVVAGAGLIVAGPALAGVVRLSLRPLRRVAGTALRVSGQNLHEGEVGALERVPAADTDPRTEVGQVGASLNRLLDHVAAALAARHGPDMPGGTAGQAVVIGPDTPGTPPGGTGPAVVTGGGQGSPGGTGGLLTSSAPGAELTAALEEDSDSYTWVAAVTGAQSASGYQLATGEPVMPLGGFNGTDPSPTLERFRQLVSAGRVHYFVEGGGLTAAYGPDGLPGPAGETETEAARISAWVAENFTPTTIDGVTVYELG